MHDLRRVFITMAERLGVPYYQIKKLANHATGKDVTFGYLVVDVEMLREPMDRINQRLLDLLHKEATLADVLEDYIGSRTLAHRSVWMYRNLLHKRLHDWMDKPVTQITHEMIRQRHKEIATTEGAYKASVTQSNMTMRILGLLMKHRRLPMPTLSKAPRRARNRRVIPDKKLAAWYQSVMGLRSTTIRDLLLMILFTGLQRRQLTGIKWTDVDLKTGTLAVGEKRLPLCSFLLDLLSSREHKTAYVFPGRQEGIVQIYQATGIVMEEIGMQFTARDLRRTYFKHAKKAGVSARALLRMDTDELREPVEIIGKRLMRIMTKTTGTA